MAAVPSGAAPSAQEFVINTEPVEFMQYSGERHLQSMIDLIACDLSEPYSVFTYRYFINNWPNLCYLAMVPAKQADDDGPAREERLVGCIVCKQEAHRTTQAMRGYIAMLAVRPHASARTPAPSCVLAPAPLPAVLSRNHAVSSETYACRSARSAPPPSTPRATLSLSVAAAKYARIAPSPDDSSGSGGAAHSNATHAVASP